MTQNGPDALAVSARDGSGVSGLAMSLILPVELRDLRYFLAVADKLNFTRAAQQLHMSQQALSVAIRRLERRLGVQLFDRSPRSVQLTSAGAALVPAAQRTLAAAEHAVTQARDAAGGLIGRLTVGVSRSAYPFGVAVLRALLERTPGIELDMHQDYAQPLVDELLAGGIDAAIVYCPESNPALRYQRLSDQPAVASLHPDHSLAGTSTLSLEDLRDETLVLAQPAIGAGYNEAILALYRDAEFEPTTAEVVGFLPPAGMRPEEPFGITTEAALDGVPRDYDLVLIPIVGHTLPFDLVWRADWDPPVLATLREVAAGVAKKLRWPRG